MLIGNSFPKLFFICVAIVSLRVIAPASILYCIISPSVRPQLFFRHPLPLPFTIWAIGEAGFAVLVCLPLDLWLQREATHPLPPSTSERGILFQRCLESVTDKARYISGWFLGSSLSQIKRENLKDFYAWSLMNKKYNDVDNEESEELDSYIDQLEPTFGGKIEDGFGPARSLRGTLETVYMQHRPLVWYLIVGLVDSITSARLFWNRFHFRRTSLSTSVLTLPMRPHTLFSSPSPSPKLSYWYREHTSKTRLPILFIHGIGVGLYTYADFLFELNSNLNNHVEDGDGEIGIIAIEVLPISSRICTPALAGDEMRDEILKILDSTGWDDFVLVGHSYGTAISATILRDRDFSKRVKAAVLMDPICFLLHLPDVAYNFTRRKPTSASERMLYYFSSQDMMISHTLARRFFWNQYILWKQDLPAPLPLTVSLSGSDIIVPTKAVWRYLTERSGESNGLPLFEEGAQNVFGDNTVEWQSGLLKMLWFEKFNHADLFACKGATRGVAKIVRDYCAHYENAVSN